MFRKIQFSSDKSFGKIETDWIIAKKLQISQLEIDASQNFWKILSSKKHICQQKKRTVGLESALYEMIDVVLNFEHKF